MQEELGGPEEKTQTDVGIVARDYRKRRAIDTGRILVQSGTL